MAENIIREANEIKLKLEEVIRRTAGYENSKIFQFCEGAIAFGPGGILTLHDLTGQRVFKAQDVQLDFYSDDDRGQYYCVLGVNDNIDIDFEFPPLVWSAARKVFDEIEAEWERIKGRGWKEIAFK